MKHSEISVGGHYQAKVAGKLTTVRVDKIEPQHTKGFFYHVTNLNTARRTTFRSAAKFRHTVTSATVTVNSSQLKKLPTNDGYHGEERDPMRPTGEELQQRIKDTEDEIARLERQELVNDQVENEKPAGRYASVAGTMEERISPFSGGSALGLASKLSAQAHSEGSSKPCQAPHLIVKARAGTGKTTTLVEGLKRVMGQGGSSLIPSQQQKAVWDAMCLGPKPSTVCFVAFNKSIAMELQRRVPQGCEAMTMHSMGYKAVMKSMGRMEPCQWVVSDIIADLLGVDIRELRRTKPTVLKATEELVSLCKMNLVGQSRYDNSDTVTILGDELSILANHYEVDLSDNGERNVRQQVFNLVPRVLDECRDPSKRRKINFDDMIWLPVVLNLPVFRFDLLLVDECQDLNRCQQALAKRAGKRLVLCGDMRQAIYGFAGADSKSMDRMKDELICKECCGVGGYCMNGQEGMAGVITDICPTCNGNEGCIVLPLTVTRRCGRAIVREANTIVPDFEAHESCCDGKVSEAKYPTQKVNGETIELPWDQTYAPMCQPGDMVLCRVNAPLVSQCFRFLKRSIKATIQGRDVGKGLISTVEKLSIKKYMVVVEFIKELSDWHHKEVSKEQAKRNPNESKIIGINDRHDCLLCFCDGATTTADVIRKIESVFTDDKGAPGIRLSSIHKAKGLEADRVFLLEPEGATVPHPMAKSAWQMEQEMNLRYVAITRAIKELVFVS